MSDCLGSVCLSVFASYLCYDVQGNRCGLLGVYLSPSLSIYLSICLSNSSVFHFSHSLSFPTVLSISPPLSSLTPLSFLSLPSPSNLPSTLLPSPHHLPFSSSPFPSPPLPCLPLFSPSSSLSLTLPYHSFRLTTPSPPPQPYTHAYTPACTPGHMNTSVAGRTHAHTQI